MKGTASQKERKVLQEVGYYLMSEERDSHCMLVINHLKVEKPHGLREYPLLLPKGAQGFNFVGHSRKEKSPIHAFRQSIDPIALSARHLNTIPPWIHRKHSRHVVKAQLP